MTTTAEALALLDDYLSGVLEGADALAYEEALFERAAADEAPEALFLDRLTLLGRFIQGRAGLGMGSTLAEVNALHARGLRVHSIEFGSGGRYELQPFPDDAEIVVTRLGVDARGFDHIEVECRTLAGQLIKTFRDVQYDRNDGAIYVVCEAPLARLSMLAGPGLATMSGVREGQREVIARFETHPSG